MKSSKPSDYVPSKDDEVAKWRILKKLNTLYHDTLLFQDGGQLGKCFLCNMPVHQGAHTSLGIIYRDMDHYVEMHDLMPNTDILEEIDRLYQRAMYEKMVLSIH
jgi:hypothetical protein